MKRAQLAACPNLVQLIDFHPIGCPPYPRKLDETGPHACSPCRKCCNGQPPFIPPETTKEERLGVLLRLQVKGLRHMAFDAIIKLQACDAVIKLQACFGINAILAIDSHGQLGINVIATKPSSYKGIPEVLNALSSF